MKPSLAKGTRDFLPLQARKRQFIFKTIEGIFHRYGYQPLETPAFENLETLMGKYGDEGDKLLFKILNSGDYLKDASAELLAAKDYNQLLPKISSKGLRYDLTVPLARVVAMNRHLIHLPFKRYQMQNVWRAERPQRGRYREFYQCDADVVGSNSLIYESELMQIYDQVFAQLGIPVRILINHRALLEGIAVEAGFGDRFMALTVAVDKLDKIGQDGVLNELVALQIPLDKAQWIVSCLQQKSLDAFRFNEKVMQGRDAIQRVFEYNVQYRFINPLEFEPSLARGLNYYTGCIFEVVPVGVKMGSLGGGGRYDNLTGMFGLNNVSGVGISFGADRIYDVMEELHLFPPQLSQAVKALFVSLDEESLQYAFGIAGQLRLQNIAADVYPEVAKLQKQFVYAEKMQIPYAVIVGELERQEGRCQLKDLHTGEQKIMSIQELIDFLKR